MSRRQSQGPGTASTTGRAIVLTAILSVVATAIAAGALFVAARGPDASGCTTVAWKALPDGAALPAGWSMESNRIFVDNLSTALSGPLPSGSSQQPAVFSSVSCYEGTAGLALRRAHEGALAAGATDVGFPTLGDELFYVSSADGSTTTLDIRRGALIADLTASTSVDRATLESIGRTIDAAMVRALAVSADASPVAQPSPIPRPSDAAAGAATPSAPPSSPAPSGSAAPPSHAAPDLEKLLPAAVGGNPLATQSVLGSTALGTSAASQALVASLQKLGKTAADLQIAGGYDPAGTLDLSMFAYRVPGLDAAPLAQALIASQLSNTAAGAESSTITIAGHPLTKISYSKGPPVYFYTLNGVVYAIQTGDTSLVANVISLLK